MGDNNLMRIMKDQQKITKAKGKSKGKQHEKKIDGLQSKNTEDGVNFKGGRM